jgi:3-hydroxybutyrate dehydrogenase
MSLVGRASLITGSTSGIGLAIAKSLASQGSDIVLNGFPPTDGSSVGDIVKSIKSTYSVKCFYVDADLSKPKQVQGLVTKASKMAKKNIDCLVNNAGIQIINPIEAFTLPDWEKVMAINLTAPFLLCQAVIPDMRAANFGRIINVSSVHGLVASTNKSAYVASKHGIMGLTKALALETAPDTNLTVNSLNPGWVDTPLVRMQVKLRADQSGRTEEEAMLMLSEKQPRTTMVQPSHLGDMCAFLCSEAGGSVTGQAMTMDGGWTAQ